MKSKAGYEPLPPNIRGGGRGEGSYPALDFIVTGYTTILYMGGVRKF